METVQSSFASSPARSAPESRGATAPWYLPPSMVEATYAELVQHILARDASARDAENEICRRFAPRIRLYGLRHLRDEERAADLVQAVLMATLEAIRAERVEEPQHLDRFMLGVCRYTALRVRQDDARTVACAPEELDLGAFEQDTHRVDVDALFRCIAALDERPRAVLQLTFQEERSSDEIAAALSITVANVRVLRHRAVAQLRTCLDGGGGA